MFESIGFSEMMLIGIIALVVVGPKDLPMLMRKAGQMMAKVRAMANDFRASFDDMARQAELDELRKEVDALKNLQPLQDVKAEFEKPFDFDGFGTTESIYTPPQPSTDLPGSVPAPPVDQVQPEAPVKKPRKRAAPRSKVIAPAETEAPEQVP